MSQGSYKIEIDGSGTFASGGAADADQLARGLIDNLKAQGHVIRRAEFTAAEPINLLQDGGQTQPPVGVPSYADGFQFSTQFPGQVLRNSLSVGVEYVYRLQTPLDYSKLVEPYLLPIDGTPAANPKVIAKVEDENGVPLGNGGFTGVWNSGGARSIAGQFRPTPGSAVILRLTLVSDTVFNPLNVGVQFPQA